MILIVERFLMVLAPKATRCLLARNVGMMLFPLVLCCANARASTYTVVNTADTGAGSLRAAIISANSDPNSTITFQSGLSGTILLGSALPNITTNMTIQGPASATIVVDGGHSSTVGGYRIFHITSASATVNISGLILQNGSGAYETNGGGGAIDNGSTSGAGGTVTVIDCVLRGNIAGFPSGGGSINGGAVANYGILIMTNCVFSGNSSLGNGGGLFNTGNAGSHRATLTNCTFSGNTASGIGGGLYAASYSTEILTNDIFYGDNASGNPEIYNNESSPAGGSAVTATYCDVQGGLSSEEDGGHNINSNPLFVDPVNLGATPPDYGNLSLSSSSPCIGAGTSSAPYYSSLDILGNTRGNPPAIGAYEY